MLDKHELMCSISVHFLLHEHLKIKFRALRVFGQIYFNAFTFQEWKRILTFQPLERALSRMRWEGFTDQNRLVQDRTILRNPGETRTRTKKFRSFRTGPGRARFWKSRMNSDRSVDPCSFFKARKNHNENLWKNPNSNVVFLHFEESFEHPNGLAFYYFKSEKS